ncbi:type VI secretion system-associated protein TagO [Escherichia coli]|nr:type VI secretion system-associated protein TagO [Escherichia coli]EFC6594954.1 type VI secretion system-associated protein TagO [Escherichia coli]EFN5255176.1 type VI secretion system-associated protein TagO [Escherichia coli]EFN5669933.1 type VI secretion system-associated protein TagO [Escherichia coli]MGK07693.1 type VI secretion system-associated protein TagO [Escherichia coli]
MQSCRRESAALERLDCYDRLLAPLSPSGFDGALVKAGFVGEAWTRATEQEKRREGNTTELLVTQVPGERPTVVITTPAIGHVPPRPVLMFSCVDNITRMQVALMHPLDVHDIAVTLNADNRALRSHWFVRENGTLLESSRGLTEQYISDYTATWRAGMDNLNIRNFESIGQLTGALEQVISGDLPLQRALTVLRDNTQPGVFSEKLSAKEREEALAEPDYQLLTRLGHEFAPENSTLAVQKDKESTMQAVYQQLTELHRYLLAIQNAPVPGKSALKAVQLRLDQNSSDPIFATRQMAKTLPAPLNRWVGRLADQAWHVVMVEAVHYMEVDWRDSVVKPFNEQLANNYPFNPRSAQDASLDAFERFFKPDGILDTFYQQNLKLFIDNDLSLEDGDNSVIIREDIIAQLKTAQKIRDIFFSKQNGLGTSFAVETVSLSGNKRRSVLNLDGQLVDYSQGRNYTAHLVWPNNMREGNESKLTLVGANGGAPRSISFSGPWAQFRLFGAGQLTGVQDGNFTVRFSVDGGAMTYRVHTDTEDNPFSGGLFSQFGLSDTLY